MSNIIQISPLVIMRWTARILGFMPSLFFVLFITGEGVPDLMEGKTSVIPIMIMILFSVAGYLIAWWKSRIGALMMIIGGLVTGIYLLILGGEGIGMIVASFSLPFIIPGGIFFMMKNVAPSKSAGNKSLTSTKAID